MQFRPNISSTQVRNLLAAFQARDTGEIPQVEVHLVGLPSGANETAFVQAFQAQPEVAFAELDRTAPSDG